MSFRKIRRQPMGRQVCLTMPARCIYALIIVPLILYIILNKS